MLTSSLSFVLSGFPTRKRPLLILSGGSLYLSASPATAKIFSSPSPQHPLPRRFFRNLFQHKPSSRCVTRPSTWKSVAPLSPRTRRSPSCSESCATSTPAVSGINPLSCSPSWSTGQSSSPEGNSQPFTPRPSRILKTSKN